METSSMKLFFYQRVEEWKDRRLEGWKAGKLENWKTANKSHIKV